LNDGGIWCGSTPIYFVAKSGWHKKNILGGMACFFSKKRRRRRKNAADFPVVRRAETEKGGKKFLLKNLNEMLEI
jgi:hypothetical protein